MRVQVRKPRPPGSLLHHELEMQPDILKAPKTNSHCLCPRYQVRAPAKYAQGKRSKAKRQCHAGLRSALLCKTANIVAASGEMSIRQIMDSLRQLPRREGSLRHRYRGVSQYEARNNKALLFPTRKQPTTRKSRRVIHCRLVDSPLSPKRASRIRQTIFGYLRR